MTSRNQILLNLARQKPLHLQNLLVATKHPHNTLCLVVASRCLFESMSSNTLMPISLGPRPSVYVEIVMVFSWGVVKIKNFEI